MKKLRMICIYDNSFNRPTESSMLCPLANFAVLFVILANAGLVCALWRALDIFSSNDAECISHFGRLGTMSARKSNMPELLEEDDVQELMHSES